MSKPHPFWIRKLSGANRRGRVLRVLEFLTISVRSGSRADILRTVRAGERHH